jgi:hypothetical protein
LIDSGRYTSSIAKPTRKHTNWLIAANAKPLRTQNGASTVVVQAISPGEHSTLVVEVQDLLLESQKPSVLFSENSARLSQRQQVSQNFKRDHQQLN